MKIIVARFLIGALALFPTELVGSFVPQPAEKATVNVKIGGVYAFPWAGPIQCNELAPGCFRVEEIDREKLRIAFARFSVKEKTIHATGFFANTVVGKAGTQEPIYTFEGKPPSQTWVHAAYANTLDGGARIDFFKIPAFVTKKARIYRMMVLDLGANSLWEKTRVEAEEPVTLMSSGAVEKAIANSKLAGIKVNGNRPRFFLPSVINVNFPPGAHEIETEITWDRGKTSICPWSVYEGRKMSLPVETELTIKNPTSERFAISLSSFGLPEEVWKATQTMLATNPSSKSIERGRLSNILTFPPVKTLAITFKPVILYRDFSFPVIACINP